MRYFIIRNRYKQDRTPSGRWSRSTYDHAREAMTFAAACDRSGHCETCVYDVVTRRFVG